MRVSTHAEIHFYQPERVSVFFENGSDEKMQHFSETLLFSLFCLRQMVNQGSAANSLAEALAGTSAVIDDLAAGHEIGDVQIIEYPGTAGRRRFAVDLDYSESEFAFRLKPRGFGILGTGLGYYAPTSVFVLLRFLAQRRAQDQVFLAKLALVSELCGQAQLRQDLTLSNQAEKAIDMASRAESIAAVLETPDTEKDDISSIHDSRSIFWHTIDVVTKETYARDDVSAQDQFLAVACLTAAATTADELVMLELEEPTVVDRLRWIARERDLSWALAAVSALGWYFALKFILPQHTEVDRDIWIRAVQQALAPEPPVHRLPDAHAQIAELYDSFIAGHEGGDLSPFGIKFGRWVGLNSGASAEEADQEALFSALVLSKACSSNVEILMSQWNRLTSNG